MTLIAPFAGGTSTTTSINPRVLLALHLLVQGYDYARDLQQEVWAFAVEIANLLSTGATTNDLRWLACKGYVQHASEINRQAECARTFLPEGMLKFNKNTCFVLTEEGSRFVRELENEGETRGEVLGINSLSATNGSDRAAIPRWDRDLQQLCLNGLLVKQFKVPAPNQETILAAFEEEGWPARIDDPLPPRLNQDAKRRLHDTINCLNRNQKHRMIRFLGDGSGEGVRWEVVIGAEPVSNGRTLARE